MLGDWKGQALLLGREPTSHSCCFCCKEPDNNMPNRMPNSAMFPGQLKVLFPSTISLHFSRFLNPIQVHHIFSTFTANFFRLLPIVNHELLIQQLSRKQYCWYSDHCAPFKFKSKNGFGILQLQNAHLRKNIVGRTPYVTPRHQPRTY